MTLDKKRHLPRPRLGRQEGDGRRRGGINRSAPRAVLSLDTPDLPRESVQDLVGLLGVTQPGAPRLAGPDGGQLRRRPGLARDGIPTRPFSA
jgi:hypothetical protein